MTPQGRRLGQPGMASGWRARRPDGGASGEDWLSALARRDWVTSFSLVGGPGHEEGVQTGDDPGLGSAPLRLLHKSGARVAAVYPRNLPTSCCRTTCRSGPQARRHRETTALEWPDPPGQARAAQWSPAHTIRPITRRARVLDPPVALHSHFPFFPPHDMRLLVIYGLGSPRRGREQPAR